MAPALILQGNSVVALFSELPDKLSASPEPVCIHSPKNCPVNADFESHTVWALLTEVLQSRDKVPVLQTSYILVIESPKKKKERKKEKKTQNKRVNILENFRE